MTFRDPTNPCSWTEGQVSPTGTTRGELVEDGARYPRAFREPVLVVGQDGRTDREEPVLLPDDATVQSLVVEIATPGATRRRSARLKSSSK